jgi:hypothetical protein
MKEGRVGHDGWRAFDRAIQELKADKERFKRAFGWFRVWEKRMIAFVEREGALEAAVKFDLDQLYGTNKTGLMQQ